MPSCALFPFIVKRTVKLKKEPWCPFIPKHIQNQVKDLPWFFLPPVGMKWCPGEAPWCCNAFPGYLDLSSNDVWSQRASLTDSMNWQVYQHCLCYYSLLSCTLIARASRQPFLLLSFSQPGNEIRDNFSKGVIEMWIFTGGFQGQLWKDAHKSPFTWGEHSF